MTPYLPRNPTMESATLSSPLLYRPFDTLPPELLADIFTSAPTVRDAVALSCCSRRLRVAWISCLAVINPRTSFAHDPIWGVEWDRALFAHFLGSQLQERGEGGKGTG